MTENLFMLIFIVVIALLLILDLFVLHKKDHEVTFKESARQTAIWVSLAMLFFLLIRFQGNKVVDVHDKDQFVAQNELYEHQVTYDDAATWDDNVKRYNKQLSLEYLTGYLIELSLSIDNVFVMIMIFLSFGVAKQYYHRVLFYGILGAIVLRFIFIFAAGALIQKFHWLLLVFGAFLIYSGIKMFIDRNKDESIDVEHHPVVKFLTKRKLSTPSFDGHNFFTKVDGRWLCTPLFVVLMIIEFSDIIFAFDSIPAIFSVTHDPHIVFFSNIFAILGLRSMFFMLESIMDKFAYLRIGLSVLLTFIGVKMFLPLVGIEVGIVASLVIIVSILTLSILLSVLFPPKKAKTNVQ
ncbi:MAG: TerC/Alx family metal homeostasis membrane protein [Bacteroidales bacterium]|jgi:tellurite resistance protein TerC|nr:TerC/Alx family metal homeostasis membrane protein [Bacteroidales bacterium]MBR4637836.1 TerC/Alx family metal homeostasis membrane protein [Bacteroidales bacterium]MBR6174797.1 TerC/Alx family metal homeostasis membrane protein [Bacteroidales bacterium]MBR6904511.1 TerC/Alx family metal homeostasis membrane protein [Bacteroidales bacterium]MCR4873763.1 TerC/Alx family metal homeostasis membrane protein [Bacteroidales bacterium]